MNETISVFVIVVTHNGVDTICDCLQSVGESKIPLQTIVIENASTDDTPEIINYFQNIIYLPQPVNLGFGQANNIGLKYALEQGADYVFLLNQDAIIRPDTLEILANYAAAHPEFGILSPLHLDGEGVEIDSKVVMYLTKDRVDFLSDLYLGRMKEVYEVNFINAAAWLISKECVNKVGGFDDLFFMYGEDDDFCHRAHMHGFKVGVIPSSTIFHKRTGRKPTANLWENLKRQAGYKASLIKARLKKDGRSFLLSVILWRIDHFAGKLSLLVKGHFGDMAILVLAGTIVLVNLPKIWAHRKISIKTQAFWN